MCSVLTSNPVPSTDQLFLTLIITSYNEGELLEQTLRSVQMQRTTRQEVILIDDGSTADCVGEIARRYDVRSIRHQKRKGIAFSRDEAALLAEGNVLGFMDAHQLVEGNSLSECAALALTNRSIVCPDIADFESNELRHGAYFTIDAEKGYFSAKWKKRKPLRQYGRVSSLKAPAYFIPKAVYPKVCWNQLQRGWGGSEAMVSLKAFFADVPILHLCGPLIRHKFKTQFHYDVRWDEVWRNHAIIARTCFDDRTWANYWLPRVFEQHLSSDTLIELDSDEMTAERDQFARYKVRSDAEFWTDLIYKEVPPEVISA